MKMPPHFGPILRRISRLRALVAQLAGISRGSTKTIIYAN